MATIPELIYCADGNRRLAKIAINAGFVYGAKMPSTVYYPVEFCDQDWKNPDLDSYLAAIKKHKPRMATVLDLEREDQLNEVIKWSESVAQFVDTIIIIPKCHGIIEKLPKRINDKEIRLGYSVPTSYGGTPVAYHEFLGWPVHVLGGRPDKALKLSKYLHVVSCDGNMHMKMAGKCSFFDYAKKTNKGLWPTIELYDGQRWSNNDAYYEAFKRSCENIIKMWKGGYIDRPYQRRLI